jgi:hypothetical protein
MSAKMPTVNSAQVYCIIALYSDNQTQQQNAWVLNVTESGRQINVTAEESNSFVYLTGGKINVRNTQN